MWDAEKSVKNLVRFILCLSSTHCISITCTAPIFIHFMYSMSVSHAPSAVMFLRKQNPRMSMGRRNVSSSLGQKKEQSEETQRWKALGQRSSPCYGQSILKISDLGRHSCLNLGGTSTILFSPKHPNLCDSACAWVCMSLLLFVCNVLYVHERHCARVFPSCLHVRLCMSACVCVW